MKVLQDRDAAQILIGVETYNATAIDQKSNHYANILGECLGFAEVGNSDAHVAEAIGLGATGFEGRTTGDLLTDVTHEA